MTPCDVVFFTNSGTEAIECALKLTRRYHASRGHPEKIDIIGFEGGKVKTWKVLSTPADQSVGILQGLREMGVLEPGNTVIHGSTVATNALLERKGAKIAFVTTKNFEDVLAIGRQARPHLYDIQQDKPPALVSRDRIFGVVERVTAGGEVLQPVDRASLEEAVRLAKESGAEAVAVGFLFSFANPAHEEEAAKALSSLGIPVSVSSRLVPEYREYERFSTAAVNAYVAPKMSRYLGNVVSGLNGITLRIMQSNGGSISAKTAAEEAARTVLSGPAGGAVGALVSGLQAGHKRLITFDMGGTSTDVALIDGGLKTTTESVVAHCPVRIPIIEIHTVGAGGGSIARRDDGGALRVGPESAGADPGPACYGRGGQLPCTTDANLVLGRLSEAHFLGGRMALHRARAEEAVGRLAESLGIPMLRCAEGIIRVANATMSRAIRVISVERGYDPRDFALLSFGGAGGLHAADLAVGLGMSTIIVPRHAGLLSAVGMLHADIVKDYAAAVLKDTAEFEPRDIERAFAPLEKQGAADLKSEGVKPGSIRHVRTLEMRYKGQSFEITVPYGPRFAAEFHRLHERAYGHKDVKRPTEIVALRIRSVGTLPKPPRFLVGKTGRGSKPEAAQKIYADGRWHDGFVYDRETLAPNVPVKGPALLIESSSTTFLPPRYSAQIERHGHLLLKKGR